MKDLIFKIAQSNLSTKDTVTVINLIEPYVFSSTMEIKVHMSNLIKLSKETDNDALYETFTYCLNMLSKELKKHEQSK